MKNFIFKNMKLLIFHKHKLLYNIILIKKKFRFHKHESSYNIILLINKIILYLQEQSVSFSQT